MLGKSHESPTENAQHQEQEPIAQNEASDSINCSEDKSIIDDTFQNHKQEAQLCESKELTESTKEKLPAQAQMEVEQSKSKKIETAALHPPSKDTITE
ncbi:hypothetical protein BPAE_0179g00100 [Botrytis paeoniae]|uniref:Uncharacterized protein n=1 Tax=Botrytis paeoniae TaxID=278948 RepID=A0A4Z1FKX2_9HELO|nr:hypothetical protein BPAE_0179g00100 [Botrytis paeoniae]